MYVFERLSNCSQRVEFNRDRGIRVNLSHEDTKGQKINSKQRVFNARIKNVGRSKGIGKRKADALCWRTINFHRLSTFPPAPSYIPGIFAFYCVSSIWRVQGLADIATYAGKWQNTYHQLRSRIVVINVK